MKHLKMARKNDIRLPKVLHILKDKIACGEYGENTHRGRSVAGSVCRAVTPGTPARHTCLAHGRPWEYFKALLREPSPFLE